MITINDYLDNILGDFKDYVNSGVKLCDLKDVHYDSGKIPDYSNIHAQQLYLLRYAYAYAFEYKRMYSYLLKKIDPEKKMECLKVTSIGCGSMIDYWALTRVVQPKCQIYYRGIDVVQWSYCMPARFRDDVKKLQGNIVELCQNTQELIADVYIFPKSISELSFEDTQKLGESFGNKISNGKLVCLLFSLRTDDGSMRRDMEKTKHIFDAMISNGFVSDDKCNEYYQLPEKIQGEKIRTLDSDFKHPSGSVDFLKDLYEKCLEYGNEECFEGDCKSRLSRWPILNCEQARWQLFRFKKEV